MRRGRAIPGPILAALCAGALAALAAHEPAFVQAVAWLAPAAVAFLVLRAGLYPAETALTRLSSRRRLPRASRIARPVARFRSIPPRGGRLVATALAGRAPPPPSRTSDRGHAIGPAVLAAGIF